MCLHTSLSLSRYTRVCDDACACPYTIMHARSYTGPTQAHTIHRLAYACIDIHTHRMSGLVVVTCVVLVKCLLS